MYKVTKLKKVNYILTENTDNKLKKYNILNRKKYIIYLVIYKKVWYNQTIIGGE